MKSCIIKLVGVSYVVFAILMAHSALVKTEETIKSHVNEGSVLATPTHPLLYNQRLDYSDSETPEIDKSHYTVEVWTAEWCSGCAIWKRRELQTLLDLGYNVVFRNYDTENPPEQVKVLPTIRLYHHEWFLKQRINWGAESIDKFVERRASLKK